MDWIGLAPFGSAELDLVDLGALPETSYISRRHAELRRDPSGQWFARDLGSRNGTFVRPQGGDQFVRITEEHPVNDGDEIALGNARFEFRAGQAS